MAVEGDIGWKLPEERQWLCIMRHWLRLCNMNNQRMCTKIFKWSVMKASVKIKNWAYRVIDFIKVNKLTYCNTDTNTNYHAVKNDLCKVLANIAEEKWLHDVKRIRSKNGKGENKLRTYRMFKSDLRVEKYVTMKMKKSHRRALALFRSGTAPINLELLRYGVNQAPVE